MVNCMLSSVSHNTTSFSNTYQVKNQNNPVEHPDNKHQKTNATDHLETKKPESDEAQKQQEIHQLKARDQEVRTHEQAHLGAAGGLATSGASFSYQKGSDGVNYAVGGEVNIDTSAVSGDAAATIRKADIIKRAALAPASPSSQDMKVAQKATAMASKARSELFQNTQNISEDNQLNKNSLSLTA